MTPDDLCVLCRAVIGRPASIVRVGSKGTVIVRVSGELSQPERLRVHQVTPAECNLIVLGDTEAKR